MSQRTLRASTYGKPPSSVTAELTEYDRGQRMGRAARISLPLLAGALLFVPVPGVHLFAVPGFLIAAIVFGLRRLREGSTVDSLSGDCPACSTEQTFPAQGSLALPLTLRCPGCGEFLKIEEPA